MATRVVVAESDGLVAAGTGTPTTAVAGFGIAVVAIPGAAVVAVAAHAPVRPCVGAHGASRHALATSSTGAAITFVAVVGVTERTEQAAQHQTGVGAPGQLEGQLHEMPVLVLRIRLGRADAQFVRLDDERALLVLEPEARDVVDDELLGGQVVQGERFAQEFELRFVLDLFQARTGQRERAVPALRIGQSTTCEDQLALARRDGEPLLGRTARIDPIRHGAVPDVRLERIQVDQTLARRHAMERAGEVLGIALQVLEHRVVLAQATRDLAAGVPITPLAPDDLLQPQQVGVVVGRRRTEHALQRAARVTADEIERDPALTVAQVAEALFIEVVRQAEVAHRIDRLAQVHELGGTEVAHDELELVAQAVAALNRFVEVARRLDLQIVFVDAHIATAMQAHVLARHTLAVLETGHRYVTRRNACGARESFSCLERGQLGLRHQVHAVLAALLQVPFGKHLGDLEVLGFGFEFQRRKGRTRRICFRTRSRSLGIGDSTRTGVSGAWGAGHPSERAWRVNRSINGRSGAPRLAL